MGAGTLRMLQRALQGLHAFALVAAVVEQVIGAQGDGGEIVVRHHALVVGGLVAELGGGLVHQALGLPGIAHAFETRADRVQRHADQPRIAQFAGAGHAFVGAGQRGFEIAEFGRAQRHHPQQIAQRRAGALAGAAAAAVLADGQHFGQLAAAHVEAGQQAAGFQLLFDITLLDSGVPGLSGEFQAQGEIGAALGSGALEPVGDLVPVMYPAAAESFLHLSAPKKKRQSSRSD